MRNSNTEIAYRWYNEVWNERKAQTIHELLAPEAVAHLTSGNTTGPDEFKLFWDQLTGAFSEIHLTIEDAVSDGDKVVVRWKISMKHTGPTLGIAPTQKPVQFNGLSWLIIREGKIVEGWDGWDSLGMMVTIGAASLQTTLVPGGA
jgi:predicted ester cyclase